MLCGVVNTSILHCLVKIFLCNKFPYKQGSGTYNYTYKNCVLILFVRVMSSKTFTKN